MHEIVVCNIALEGSLSRTRLGSVRTGSGVRADGYGSSLMSLNPINFRQQQQQI